MSYINDYPFGGGLPNGESEILRDPHFLDWTVEEVGNWIEASGYPNYRDCFERNFITGRKLITIDASTLPKMGITNFDHVKDIAKLVRDLLEIEKPTWGRSISLPPREKLAAFLERKSRTGVKSESLTYTEFCEEYNKILFCPPLANEGLIIGSCKLEDCGPLVYYKSDL